MGGVLSFRLQPERATSQPSCPLCAPHAPPGLHAPHAPHLGWQVANEPPTDVKSLFKSAYALFNQETIDKSTKQVQFKPMLFSLSFFHSLCLGRRKFGMQGFSRAYAWNNGDLTVCAMILHNYLENNKETPWADVRYLFGEVMCAPRTLKSGSKRLLNFSKIHPTFPALLLSCRHPAIQPHVHQSAHDQHRNTVPSKSS